MGQVKEWAMEIAEMVYTRGMATPDVVEVLYNQAVVLLDGRVEDPASLRSWLTDQVEAVRNNPKMYNRDSRYWEFRRKLDNTIEELRNRFRPKHISRKGVIEQFKKNFFRLPPSRRL